MTVSQTIAMAHQGFRRPEITHTNTHTHKF